MDFEQFKRRVGAGEVGAPLGATEPGQVYQRFLEETFEALRTRRHPSFTAREAAESLSILARRFRTFLVELERHDCAGDAAAEEVSARMGRALLEMVASVEELRELAATPEDERVGEILARFRQASDVILEVQQEMQAATAANTL